FDGVGRGVRDHAFGRGRCGRDRGGRGSGGFALVVRWGARRAEDFALSGGLDERDFAWLDARALRQAAHDVAVGERAARVFAPRDDAGCGVVEARDPGFGVGGAVVVDAAVFDADVERGLGGGAAEGF